MIKKGDQIKCIKTPFNSITKDKIYVAECDEYYAYMCGYNITLKNDNGEIACYLSRWFETV